MLSLYLNLVRILNNISILFCLFVRSKQLVQLPFGLDLEQCNKELYCLVDSIFTKKDLLFGNLHSFLEILSLHGFTIIQGKSNKTLVFEHIKYPHYIFKINDFTSDRFWKKTSIYTRALESLNLNQRSIMFNVFMKSPHKYIYMNNYFYGDYSLLIVDKIVVCNHVSNPTFDYLEFSNTSYFLFELVDVHIMNVVNWSGISYMIDTALLFKKLSSFSDYYIIILRIYLIFVIKFKSKF